MSSMNERIIEVVKELENIAEKIDTEQLSDTDVLELFWSTKEQQIKMITKIIKSNKKMLKGE